MALSIYWFARMSFKEARKGFPSLTMRVQRRNITKLPSLSRAMCFHLNKTIAAQFVKGVFSVLTVAMAVIQCI